MTEFFQDGPRLSNQYLSDASLRAVLANLLPDEVLSAIEPGLEHLGERAVTDLADMAADAHRHPPQLVPFDAWGRRVDRIVTSDGWRRLHAAAAREGIVATAFEREHGEFSRVHQFARLYLYNPSSAIYSCPLAMTDGAARVIELLGDEVTRAMLLPRLTSRDPASFWTSGQWMTERTGGSDVSGTSTIARRDEDGTDRLHGDKWFTSATTADMALTLAREEGREGLSLFWLRTRDDDGAMNAIRIHRLKDKLGTRAMPTAELSLDGTPAYRLGDPGAGVRNIATMLNVTRCYNAVCAVSTMRRALALASDYATRRRAFGRTLAAHPLHVETLADMAVETSAALQLVFHVGRLLGRDETGVADDRERCLLRLLTPVVKLYTGKQAVAVASEALECFGGAGYIEDTGLPVLLRDAQVLSIWEGTTNVLSLDVQRVLAGGEALAVFADDVTRRLSTVTLAPLAPSVSAVRAALDTVTAFAGRDIAYDIAETGARRFAFALARVFAGSLLLAQAQVGSSSPGAQAAVDVARRWCAGRLAPLSADPPRRLHEARRIFAVGRDE